jgi:hypothetical protein
MTESDMCHNLNRMAVSTTCVLFPSSLSRLISHQRLGQNVTQRGVTSEATDTTTGLQEAEHRNTLLPLDPAGMGSSDHGSNASGYRSVPFSSLLTASPIQGFQVLVSTSIEPAHRHCPYPYQEQWFR